MKVKPVVDALEAAGAETVLVHTGQHYDAAMSDVFFERARTPRTRPPPGRRLGHPRRADRAGHGGVRAARRPRSAATSSWSCGDVNSTARLRDRRRPRPALRVAHVEAGLRSRDWAMPEEINRVVTDRVSDLLFAPSPDAVDNLRAEGYRDDQIHLVGNVMIDTLLANLDRPRRATSAGSLGLGRRRLRRRHAAPAGQRRRRPTARRSWSGRSNAISAELPLVFPVHPRTRPKLADARHRRRHCTLDRPARLPRLPRPDGHGARWC